jgi:hypothetical protein
MEHFSGDKLPAGMAKAIAEGEFVACINPETVGEGQSPTGFLNDRPLVSARDQERSDTKKKKRLESHERFGVGSKSAIFAVEEIVLFQATRNQFRKLAIF